MDTVKEFPFLSQTEYVLACRELVCAYEHSKDGQSDWLSAEVKQIGDHAVLRICRIIGTNDGPKTEVTRKSTVVDEELAESDEEALYVPPKTEPTTVEYDIVLSPSYRVPVLHLSVRPSSHKSTFAVDEIYNLLVPQTMTAELDNVGTLGGLTMVNHPATGVPTYSVHPCLTADAMREVASDHEIRISEYL